MKPFMDEEFLLTTPTASALYHCYAAKMPIIDYHCHINPEEIATDRQFDTITQLWLGGDHYKWRLMRSFGIDEALITGTASDRDKFIAWAGVLGRAAGNPLFHWSHLELKRYFNYDGVLNAQTAEQVWDHCNRLLQHPSMSVRSLIKASNVKLLCTTDDPVDSLVWHEQIAADASFDVQVLPAWRPDFALNLERGQYTDYLASLSKASGKSIQSFTDLKCALSNRLDYFAAHGCLLSDHGLDYVMYVPVTEAEASAIFDKRLNGGELTVQEVLSFKTMLLLFLGEEYHLRGWTMQLHFGTKRNNNTASLQTLGADTGFDCIHDNAPISQLADFLDALASKGCLPKTILYSLNPNDNAAIGTLIGCFQSPETAAKIQHGSAWWFNDHKRGMLDQLSSLASLGNLSGFIGMLTDSRSFLSYTRHEYFRRILCDYLGGLAESGEFPADMEVLGPMVQDISYGNAVSYFGFTGLSLTHEE